MVGSRGRPMGKTMWHARKSQENQHEITQMCSNSGRFTQILRCVGGLGWKPANPSFLLFFAVLFIGVPFTNCHRTTVKLSLLFDKQCFNELSVQPQPLAPPQLSAVSLLTSFFTMVRTRKPKQIPETKELISIYSSLCYSRCRYPCSCFRQD